MTNLCLWLALAISAEPGATAVAHPQILDPRLKIELVAADGSVAAVHRSQISSRYIYKNEMELLLRVAGFARWGIHGDFDGTPLTLENQAMVVSAWNS